MSPRPGPSVNKIAVTPKAANAPPNIAAHSTADAELSTDRSSTLVAAWTFAMAVSASSRRRPNGQLFRFLQMMLDGRKRFLGKLLHIGIIAFRSVLLKEVHGLFMCIDLLIGICFVKILCGALLRSSMSF